MDNEQKTADVQEASPEVKVNKIDESCRSSLISGLVKQLNEAEERKATIEARYREAITPVNAEIAALTMQRDALQQYK